MNHDNPHALARSLPFRNVADEVIPAYATMTVLGVSHENGIAFLLCGKPNATLQRQFAINGSQDVASGRRGNCFRSHDIPARYAAGTPLPGEGWGPQPGAWFLQPRFPGVTVTGIINPDLQIARVDCQELQHLIVKTTAPIAAGAQSSSYRIQAGEPGSEFDAGYTVVPLANNRSGVSIDRGQRAHLHWINNAWELQPFVQPTRCAVPPCGASIPARVGEVPGQLECCLFSLEDGGHLVPLLNNEEQHVRAMVYNIRDVPIASRTESGQQYLLVHPDAAGRWICEPPTADAAQPEPSNPTPPTANPNLSPCQGTCKWNWSIGQSAWILESGTCVKRSLETTTSSSSTTTTTPEPCLCPTAESTTSSTTTSLTTSTSTSTSTTTTTSSTTTTTAEPCQCIYPTFCGSEEGECTFTDCALGYQRPRTSCTTTSSEPCDCNTTTTLPPDPKCTECHWFKRPGGGYFQLMNGCQGQCYCSPPSRCFNECGSCPPTPCQPLPPPPPCQGTCEWLCVGSSEVDWRWRHVGGGCNIGSLTCRCYPPEAPCHSCGAIVETECQTITPDDPPKRHRCKQCYTTTTTTTTVEPPCGTGCKWRGDAHGTWTKTADHCGSQCNCLQPAY